MNQRKRNRLLKQHKILDANVKENIEKYTPQIIDIIMNAINSYPEGYENLSKNLFNFFNLSFENTTTLTKEELQNIYSSVSESYDINNIINQTYNKDGLTLQERIEKWGDEAGAQLEAGENKELVASDLTAKILRIFRNENEIIKNVAENNLLNKIASIIEIVGECNCRNGECEQYVGTYDIDDAYELPPYHAFCQCEAIYDITDDPDDFNDLDIEPESLS